MKTPSPVYLLECFNFTTTLAYGSLIGVGAWDGVLQARESDRGRHQTVYSPLTRARFATAVLLAWRIERARLRRFVADAEIR
jgi:hypothetical protein